MAIHAMRQRDNATVINACDRDETIRRTVALTRRVGMRHSFLIDDNSFCDYDWLSRTLRLERLVSVHECVCWSAAGTPRECRLKGRNMSQNSRRRWALSRMLFWLAWLWFWPMSAAVHAFAFVRCCFATLNAFVYCCIAASLQILSTTNK